MEHFLLNVAVPVVIVLLVAWSFADDICFLWQGRWYRRLDADAQSELTRDDPEWHQNHGRPIPRSQLIVGIVATAVILGWLVWSRLSK